MISATPSRLEELVGSAPDSLERISLSWTQLETEPERWLSNVQRALRPGGELRIGPPGRASRRMARRCLGFFVPGAHDGQGRVFVKRPRRHVASHFDALAHEYKHEIPAAVQAHFFEKKFALLQAHLPTGRAHLGLEIGCGQGAYVRALARERGDRVVGVDLSARSLAGAGRDSAATKGAAFAAADALRLPFRDGTFDYALAVNTLHHLKRGEQEAAVRELHRVLRPRAVLVVHEMNTTNPLVRWYLRKVFPRTRRIDRGDEDFIAPKRWPLVEGFRLVATDFRTFVPDFAPRWSLGPLKWLEGVLERSPLRRGSVHYSVALERTEV